MNDLSNRPEMDLYAEIRETLLSSRNRAYAAVNFAMVQAYWEIGRIIVEHEQNGSLRAEYGKGVLEEVSQRLTDEFGKGFTLTNLKYMRQFYATFPNGHALRGELSWTHYRALLRVENDVARNWYMEEAIKAGWSSRQLERQISTLYYERLLASRDQVSVIAEAQEKLLTIQPESFIKDLLTSLRKQGLIEVIGHEGRQPIWALTDAGNSLNSL